jgi:hypothetical protein
MKSGKQRKEEIKTKRLERLARYAEVGKHSPLAAARLGAVAFDASQIAPNESYSVWPAFYIDHPFVCRDCGSHEMWTAKQQKWWYEIAKGPVGSRAVRCATCRVVERSRADEARRISREGMERKMAEKQLKVEQ